MKKLMMIAALMLMSIGAFAQEAGKMAVGVDLNMIFKDSSSRFALGAKLQYELIENLRAEASLKFYPKKDEDTRWNVNLNCQYVIPVADKINVYPIVGLGLLGVSYSKDVEDPLGVVDLSLGSSPELCFVVHGGAGAECFVSDNIKLYFEALYQYGKKDGVALCDNPLLSLGVAYAF